MSWVYWVPVGIFLGAVAIVLRGHREGGEMKSPRALAITIVLDDEISPFASRSLSASARRDASESTGVGVSPTEHPRRSAIAGGDAA